MKTIAISGINGFLGKNLESFFSKLNYKILGISRDILDDKNRLENIINSSNIVINLAGANIVKRWTKTYKEELYFSRINTTSKIVQAINSATNKPKLFISSSAIGIYDNSSTCDENSKFSNDFLSKLCQDWEKEALKVKNEDTKVAIFRLSVVLGKNGGALGKMLKPFKLGLGGTIGDGEQAFSFIHIEDLLNAYKFIIDNNYDGVFNLSSPRPTTNKELTKVLGKTLKRPTIFPLPKVILKLIFGEGARVLVDSQTVLPQKLLDLKFDFKFENIEDTIENLCNER